jgi:hypothetical protein
MPLFPLFGQGKGSSGSAGLGQSGYVMAVEARRVELRRHMARCSKAVEARSVVVRCVELRSVTSRRSRQGSVKLGRYVTAVMARLRLVGSVVFGRGGLGVARQVSVGYVTVWRSRRGVMWSGKLWSGGASHDNLRRSRRGEAS